MDTISEMMNLINKCSEDDVPVASILVNKNNEIVSRGFNVKKTKNIISGHAEIEAINNYMISNKIDNLSELTLYSTLKPCLMCVGAIKACKIGTVFYLVDNKFNNYDFIYDIKFKKIENKNFEEIIKNKLNSFFKKLR